MPVTQGRTREQIRVAVGENIGAVYLGKVTGQGSGANQTDFDDALLQGGDDDYNGKWWLGTGPSNNDGVESRVADFVDTNERVTITPAVTTNFAVDDTYEMWDEEYRPTTIERYINEAIISATGRVFDPEEDISLFADGHQTRFDIPTDFEILTRLEYRSKATLKRVHAFGSTFDTTTHAEWTQSLDTEDKKQAAQSLKISLSADAEPADFVMKTITAIDLSAYTHVEFWVKSSVALSAADYKLHMHSSAITTSGGSHLESLDVPAVSADTWTYHRVALNTPETDTAIISLAIEQDQDKGAHTVWFDDWKAVNIDRDVWEPVPSHLWRIDKEARDLILTDTARISIGYNMLRLSGGGQPALLTTDAAVSEVPDDYIIAMATAQAMSSQGDSRAGHWWNVANRAAKAFPFITNGRHVE